VASIERTAYPRFSRKYTPADLKNHFTVSETESKWIRKNNPTPALRLSLAVLLKCFQHLRYIPDIKLIPAEIILHVRESLGYSSRIKFGYTGKTPLHRHSVAIRKFLDIEPFYGKRSLKVAEQIAQDISEILDQKIDIINTLIEELVQRQIELPAFSTLENLAEQSHAAVQERLFKQTVSRLVPDRITDLNRLLETDFGRKQSDFNTLKKAPKKPSRKHLEVLVDHLTWLESFGDLDAIFKDVRETKIRFFASQAMIYDVAELKECARNKRYTLMLALIYRMRVRARDHLAEMFIRRMAMIHKRAKDELLATQARQRNELEQLVVTLDGVLEILDHEPDDLKVGPLIRKYVGDYGSVDALRQACANVKAVSGDNYLPMLWRHFRSHRPLMFKLVDLLQLEPTTQDRALMKAFDVVRAYESYHREWIDEPVDISFASDRWKKLIRRPAAEGPATNRRYLELCVFSYLAEELRSGDLCVEGSESFADYRRQLLPWEECQAMLPDYCKKIGLPDNAQDFVAGLKAWLTETADELDQRFPSCRGDVSINAAGEPVLKRVAARDIPPSAIALQEAIVQRMPSRHLVDVLANIEHWIEFTRHFGPLSGNETKLQQPAERYLMTIFAMGCNLGPTQAARHLAGGITPHMLSYVNRRHLTLDKLETAQRELTELYLQLDLPKMWGDGKSVAADGTQYDFYDQNLLAGFHFRYRKMGAVAYRHVANNYIAYFRHFIPPGVWEAVYVIEGLLKTDLSVEADTVYSDTQGQSATVFAFTYLMGIKLMPRIRNWKDLKLYRPDRQAKYKHIDKLFADTADWDLIETHWQDLMQVMLSIVAGKISSATLLRKLGSYSRKNRLYHAAQALGNVVRTVYLLQFIGSREIRQDITANTNKTESYHSFSKWLSFGGDVIAENDPDEQQKRLRYIDLMAAAVILQNAVDMMRAIMDLSRSGWEITEDDISFLSPYLTANLKRFGEYTLKLNRPPEKWIRDATFAQAARSAKVLLHATERAEAS